MSGVGPVPQEAAFFDGGHVECSKIHGDTTIGLGRQVYYDVKKSKHIGV